MDQHGNHFSYPDMQPPQRKNYLFAAYLIMFGVMLGMVLMNVFSPRFREPAEETVGTSPVSEVPPVPEAGAVREPAVSPAATDGMLTDYEHAIIAAVRQATPAVVTITTSGTVYYRYRQPLFNIYSGVMERDVSELGSGVIIDPDGTIITNEHVISMVQNVSRAQIKVELTDGRSFDAHVERALYNQDIAILKIDAHDLPYLEVNQSTDLVQGQTVLAIGNPFGLNRGGEPTVTRGIVSATRRNLAQPDDNGVKYLRNMIQTDAAINEGNSGGALIDLNGRLVGINTAIYTNNGEGSIGIGFAIPADQVRFILDSVAQYAPDAAPWSGIGIQALTPAIAQALGFDRDDGVVISGVEKGSPGEKYGFEQGDIITDINGYPVSTVDEARAIFRGAFPGEQFELQIFRRGGTRTLELVLGEKE